MELINPFILYIGIPTILILSVIRLKRKNKYIEGKKIANTQYVKDMPYYKSVLRKYKLLTNSIKLVSIISIIVSLILLARPAKINTSSSPIYNRDIFLCMDASGSMAVVNEQIVESLKDMVKKLKGERIGITIFNTSSVLEVPLTDDYEYVLEKLDNLQKAFQAYNKDDISYNDVEGQYYKKYMWSGTTVGNTTRGSSLIGDGLASCVYNFNNLETDRTRIIIFSTDNDVDGKPLLTLGEAAQVCKENNVTVYGIVPNEITWKGIVSKVSDSKKQELKKAVEVTGGTLYEANSSTTVSSIVKNIESKSVSLIQGNKEIKKVEQPQLPFILLMISIIIMFILNKKVKL